MSHLRARAFRPGDEVAIEGARDRMRAHLGAARARAGLPVRHVPPEEWSWRQSNPAGLRAIVVEAADGTLVQALVGTARRAAFDGRETTWTEIVDWVRDPQAGRGVDAVEWLTCAARAFVERFAGVDEGQDALSYGLPSPRLRRLVCAELNAEVVRSQNALRLSPDRFADSAPPGIEVEEVTGSLPAELDDFAHRAIAHFGAASLRDARSLEWRFRDHPRSSYRIALARRGAEIQGLAVLGAGEPVSDWTVADWLILPDDPEAGDALRGWLGRTAFGAGAASLTAWLPEWTPDWTAFQCAAYRVEGTPWFFTARPAQRRFGDLWLYAQAYFTLGDLDRG